MPYGAHSSGRARISKSYLENPQAAHPIPPAQRKKNWSAVRLIQLLRHRENAVRNTPVGTDSLSEEISQLCRSSTRLLVDTTVVISKILRLGIQTGKAIEEGHEPLQELLFLLVCVRCVVVRRLLATAQSSVTTLVIQVSRRNH